MYDRSSIGNVFNEYFSESGKKLCDDAKDRRRREQENGITKKVHIIEAKEGKKLEQEYTKRRKK